VQKPGTILSVIAGLAVAWVASIVQAAEPAGTGAWPSLILLGKAWAVGYVLVALGVLLGIAVVARPSRRKKDKRRIN
jgi:hypothetical protein